MRRIVEEIVSEMNEGGLSRRDPGRIDAVLSKLREVWMQDPDMRFGQLVYNLYWPMPETKKTGEVWIDMFYVEDDAFERRLDGVIREGWKSPKP